jgi:hypothetical protein
VSWKKLGGAPALFLLVIVVLNTLGRGLWFLALLAGVVGSFAVGQYWVRSRAAHRRAAGSAAGSGYWRMWLYGDREMLLGEARRGTGWLYTSMAPVTVTSDSEGLTFAPTAFGDRVCGYRRSTVPWSDVVGVTSKDLGRTTPDGKLSFTPRTELTLTIRGERVPWWRRRDWESGLRAELTPEDDPLDAESLAIASDLVTKLRNADEAELDQATVVLVTDGPDGFLDQVAHH